MADEKVRENRLRRMAERQGFRLLKSRRRDHLAPDYGGFMLVDGYTNNVVTGAHHFAYSADLNEVEAFLSNPKTGPSK